MLTDVEPRNLVSYLKISRISSPQSRLELPNRIFCVPVEEVKVTDSLAVEKGASHRAVEPIILSVATKKKKNWLTSTCRLG